jgi:hypothetical protein
LRDAAGCGALAAHAAMAISASALPVLQAHCTYREGFDRDIAVVPSNICRRNPRDPLWRTQMLPAESETFATQTLIIEI